MHRKPNGSDGAVAELVNRVRRDVDHIAEAELMHFTAELHLTVAAQDEDDVFVGVMLQRREALGRDLKIADVEGSALAALSDQRRAQDAAPVIGGRLVRIDGDPFPAETRLPAQYARLGNRTLVSRRAGADVATARRVVHRIFLIQTSPAP